MPTCVCGTVLTDSRNADEQFRWSDRLGDCWDYRENGTAYWFRCRRCRLRERPNDYRVNNRWSRMEAMEGCSKHTFKRTLAVRCSGQLL